MLKNALRALVKTPIETRTGRLKHRLSHARDKAACPTLDQVLDTLERDESANEQGGSPVFLLGSGWRCGSTLVQRLLMSDNSTIIWGEPYYRSAYIQRMAESLLCLSEAYPPKGYFLDSADDLTGDFVANLYPSFSDLRSAHRQFLLHLFAEPGCRAGFDRWGVKEVRLSASHARYLKFLFPGARILFLFRNPYAAYRSYRQFGSWYLRWPEQKVFTARHFGMMWKEFTSGYIEQASALDAHLVQFEQLVGNTDEVTKVAEYTGLAIDQAVLDVRVSGRGSAPPPDPVPRAELRILRRAVDPLASELGYTMPR